MPYARAANDAAIYYNERGAGPETLILLAGQTNNHHWWDLARHDFDARFRTIALDWRGTGDSGKPDDDSYTIDTFVADVIAVLDSAGVPTAHVYGTSMGGRVAQWMAVDHADRVDRLVLGCTSPGARHGVEASTGVKRSLTQPDPAEVRSVLLDLMYTPAWLAGHHEPYNTLGDQSMPSHSRRGHLRASLHHDSWEALPRITAPTLVVHGTDDLLNPAANAPLIAERIPNARLAMIDGARHAYFEEFRGEAAPLVLDFLTG